MGHLEGFLDGVGDQNDGGAVVASVADLSVDGLCGAGVEAAERVIEQEHLHVLRIEPLRQDDLLLVSARESPEI